MLSAAGTGVRVLADLPALIAGAEGRAGAEAGVTTLRSLLPNPGKAAGAGSAPAGAREYGCVQGPSLRLETPPSARKAPRLVGPSKIIIIIIIN